MSFKLKIAETKRKKGRHLNIHALFCMTMQQSALRNFFHVSRPTFIIPIFRAPTTISTIKTTIDTNKASTTKLISAILKQEQKSTIEPNFSSSNMISQRIFENLILTNTIVAAFCIVLMVTLTGFLIFLLIPSVRRRWLNNKQNDKNKLEDISTLSRQPSFHHFTLGPSRLNPLFEPAAGTTTATTHFGTLFHPQATTATLLHPTIWTPIASTSAIASPVPSQKPQVTSTPPVPPKTKATSTTTTTATTRPPLPTRSTTTVRKSPKK